MNTGFFKLAEILTLASSVHYCPVQQGYIIDADPDTVSTTLTELQSMACTLAMGQSAMNYNLAKLIDHDSIDKENQIEILMFKSGLAELHHVIVEATHSISMAKPTGQKKTDA